MRSNASTWLKVGIAALAVIIVVGYAYGRLRDLIDGPSITVESPANGATVTDPLAVIRGHAERVQNITLNGRTIFISTDGQIAEPIVLAPGFNKIELSAADRFGRTRALDLALVYQNPSLSAEAGGNLMLSTSTEATPGFAASSTGATATPSSTAAIP